MDDTFIENLRGFSANHVVHRVWVISDLQQSDLGIARQCLTTAIEDFKSLSLNCEQIWYLGDSVQGTDEVVLKQMAEMQIELLGSLKIPLIFTSGNHEFDPYWYRLDDLPLVGQEQIKVISRDIFSKKSDWKTSEKISDFYFTDKLGDYTLFFFPDHAHSQGQWLVGNGKVHGDVGAYPHTKESYQNVVEQIKDINGPVITAGHNSFAGGLRSSPLLSQMLPLPNNVRAHFYGHCHIGDVKWGGPESLRKLSTVDYQNIPQIDIAALENHRGDAVRSTVFEIYEDGTFGVLLREHCKKRWSDAYFLANNYKSDQ
jgi:hypothetical protein